MRKIIALFLTVLLITPVQSQSSDEGDAAIIFPVSGKMVVNRVYGGTPSTPVLLNTINGEEGVIPTFGELDPSGRYLMFVEYKQLIQTDLASGTTQSLNESAVSLKGNLFSNIDWSGDGSSILYELQVFSEPATYPATSRLEILDLQTQTTNIVLEIPANTPMKQFAPMLDTSETMIFESIRDFKWHPIFPEWVVLAVSGLDVQATGEEAGILDTGLYNSATKQYISFTTLFPQAVISLTDWSADGTKIAMNTVTGITIVQFDLGEGIPQLSILADGIESEGQAVIEWFGPGDLLLTAIDADGFYNKKLYPTSFIAQAIDGKWYSQEFVSNTQHLRAVFTGDAFFFTGSDEEAAKLSCMFYDTVYPPKLDLNNRARVTFTDGTPSRLRAAPGTEGDEVLQMAEGTEFNITGSAYCVDGYRWWPLQLEDGTTGWAAEGTADEAWLETLPS